MNNYFGIKKTHQFMTNRLIDYITSQYFGDNQLLLNASSELLSKEGNLYQKPYIESTPSYVKVQNGITNSRIPPRMKQFFNDLIDNNLGVFNTPFKHQVEALEYFSKGRNLFVATGTGSGKTECFMWPIIYKIANEAISNENTWKLRSVRAIIIYPMNALVSDQIARLRSIIGDESGKFNKILSKYSNKSRIPQFGMYTGRTPYPGNKQNKKYNEEIANSFKESYIVDQNLSIEEKEEKQREIIELKRAHKYPSKNMKKFIENLELNSLDSYDSASDPELILRFEMQNYIPDILITNYSMLEYMLIRNTENNIWTKTKEWLNSNKDNKLLLVIDEAHMYSGASGGEVAFLIKRLFSKLGVIHDKVQFILTSASMPNDCVDDVKSIQQFAEDLSGCDKNSFEYLYGEKTKLILQNEIKFNLEELANLELKTDILDDKTVDDNIRRFANKIFKENVNESPSVWLYKNISRYSPFINLLENCKGTATSYYELQRKTIGDLSEMGTRAFENLLLLAPLAKDTNNNALFPARIHMFFRGLNGIYACLNPNCICKHEGDGLHLGELYSANVHQCKKCYSKIYELANDRRCGALFIKTYIHKNSIGKPKILCWSKKGLDEKNEMIEYPLFIIPDNYQIVKEKTKTTSIGYFNYFSGMLYSSKGADIDNCIKVLVVDNPEETKMIFKRCPYCNREFRFIGLSDFKVKGNIPFYTLVRAQFDAQSMIKNPTIYTPNGGRKTLLFSDSRQSAAILARDMTKISDRESFRKAIYMALEKIYSSKFNQEIALGELYPAFLEVCVENKLRFFYGNDLEKFEYDKNHLVELYQRGEKRNIKIKYERLIKEFSNPCKMYLLNLIDLFCGQTINFYNLGIGYIAPMDEILDDILYDLKYIKIDKESYIEIFAAFVTKTCLDSFSFDNTVEQSVRREVKYIKGNRYGFFNYDSYMNEHIKDKYPNDYKKIYETIVKEFYDKNDNDYFLNLKKVKVVLIKDKEIYWYRCNKCGSVHPFAIDNKCSICGKPGIFKEYPNDIRKISFWRTPIIGNCIIKSLNTEEHTAQLSFKDQKIKTWAKTEDYEMRFQDINVENDKKSPIDILSCTTTMEVGIDIGSLTAIGLRNIPPLRENYQQRVGRAGRRGSSLSTILIYAQGGPHDTYYFNSPDKIIKGKLRKPWIDVQSDKIIYRHFNLITFTKFFETTDDSLYDVSIGDFRKKINIFSKYVKNIIFSDIEIKEYFLGHTIETFREKLIYDVNKFIDTHNDDKKNFLDEIFGSGILPTYSFPLDVIEFNIEDSNSNTVLSPQRGIDIALSEYAPGRTIVVDKKTYKSAGIYSPNSHNFSSNPYKPAEPYFNEENGYYKEIYICSNPLCGWFSLKKTENGKCPFCGRTINLNLKNHMLIPWGFAPLNAKDIPESEAESELTYLDEPCYSATPSDDLCKTKYDNILVSNRKNEEIIILNKGIENQGFDVCTSCGAAQPHNQKKLKDNGIFAPFTLKGNKFLCQHNKVEEGIFLGTSFRTDMFFMQIYIDEKKLTSNDIILKSAAITLCEAMKLATSRILDISYNDLSIGTRTRTDGKLKFIDIYFYDSLSSGAGYSTQILDNLDEIICDTYEILNSNDDRDICNFWNQKIQYMFNKEIAFDFLNWMTKSELPSDFSAEETNRIIVPLLSALNNREKTNFNVIKNELILNNKKYKIIKAIMKKNENDISDFEINQELPLVIEEKFE